MPAMVLQLARGNRVVCQRFFYEYWDLKWQ